MRSEGPVIEEKSVDPSSLTISEKIARLKDRFARLDASPKHARFRCLTKYSALDFNASAYTIVNNKLIIYAFPNRQVVIPPDIKSSLGEDIEIVNAPIEKRILKAQAGSGK